MEDYENGEGLSEGNTEVNLAMFAAGDGDPTHFDVAVKIEKWRKAMDGNDTWELMELSDGAKKVGVKWVYKTKFKEHGEVDKYKTRLMVKGNAQEYGVNYTKVFVPVACMETIRLVVALTAQKGWTIYQLDVKSAFLHGELNETVYVDQPCGYVQKGDEHKVYKLKKPHKSILFEGSMTTSILCEEKEDKVLIVSLYVNDPIFTGNDELMFAKFKSSMKHEFDMTNLDKMGYFLGLEVLQQLDGIFLCQKKYALEMLQRFEMDRSNSVHNPIIPGVKLTKDESNVKVDKTYYKQIVGSLMYLTSTRPDMMYMENPIELHLLVAKRVLRYLKGTTEFGIFYKKGGNKELLAYLDSDYAGDLDDRKSTLRYIFLLYSTVVSWLSRKQPIVSLSTIVAEFIGATSCACQAIWLKRVLGKLCKMQSKATMICCDSSYATKLSKNPVMHGCCKHIDDCFHFLRDLTKDGTIEMMHCGTQEQVVDIMTSVVNSGRSGRYRAGARRSRAAVTAPNRGGAAATLLFCFRKVKSAKCPYCLKLTGDVFPPALCVMRYAFCFLRFPSYSVFRFPVTYSDDIPFSGDILNSGYPAIRYPAIPVP
ncbi:hypothetical protein CR513_24401, partial [Mucuna pruriens]